MVVNTRLTWLTTQLLSRSHSAACLQAVCFNMHRKQIDIGSTWPSRICVVDPNSVPLLTGAVMRFGMSAPPLL
jgi:hypothetical protein